MSGSLLYKDAYPPTIPGDVNADVVETNSKQLKTLVLASYTTTARDALSVPAGTLIFNTTTSKINVYTGSAWEAVTSA